MNEIQIHIQIQNWHEKKTSKSMICVFKLFAAIKRSFMHEFRFND